jgi:hypothetical protein
LGLGATKRRRWGISSSRRGFCSLGLAGAGRLRSCLLAPTCGAIAGPGYEAASGLLPQSPAGECALAAAANSVGPLGVRISKESYFTRPGGRTRSPCSPAATTSGSAGVSKATRVSSRAGVLGLPRRHQRL